MTDAEPTPTVVVGTDGSEGSLVAVRVAAAEARLRNGELVVLCAWHPSAVGSIPAYGVGMPVADTLAELREALGRTLDAEGLGADGDLVVHPVVVQDHAARALIEASADADLVVVGTRGHGGFTGLVLGSVSHQVASHATCPVMVVPAPA
jgi:nucleotide-binding universal stress UspA family protein